jgi:hypothetical protein
MPNSKLDAPVRCGFILLGRRFLAVQQTRDEQQGEQYQHPWLSH